MRPLLEDVSRDEQLDAIRSFDRRPKEIRDYLDRFVIKQEQAKESYLWLFATITIMLGVV